MKQAVSRLNTADWTMNGPSASVASTTSLNRRQLLSGMAAAAALLAAQPWALAPAVPTHMAPTRSMGAFEALRIFLQAGAHPR